MTDNAEYYVVLFKSVSHALRSEKILNNNDVPFKIIPVPKQISSDCGVCIRFTPDNRKKIEEALNGKVELKEIRSLIK